MLPELINAGLPEKEARVYLAALEIGRATADQISRQAKVNRSTTYVQIDSLMAKGLMSTFDEGKKTYFLAESPEHLKRLIEYDREDLADRERAVSRVLPGLTGLFEHADERPVTRFFSGKEGIVAMREEMLRTKEKKWLVMFSHDSMQNIFSQEELDRYSERRAKLGIISKAVYTKKGGKYSGEQAPLAERAYLPPEKFPIQSHVVIFDDTVAFVDYMKRVGVLISNKSISDSLRAVFNILWEAGEK